MIGLVKTVTPQLKRLSFCIGTASTSAAHVQCAVCDGFVEELATDAISLP